MTEFKSALLNRIGPRNGQSFREWRAEVTGIPFRKNWKAQARGKQVQVEPNRNYTPSEVAAILNVSYDTALRQMQKMKHVVDLGTQTRRYKRGKKMLRISGKHLVSFIQNKIQQ